MRLLNGLAVLSSALILSASSQALPSRTTLYYQALSSPSSSPHVLATIAYDRSTLEASFDTWTPPSKPDSSSTHSTDSAADEELIRLGVSSPDSKISHSSPDPKTWHSILTSSSVLSTSKSQRGILSLHLDGDGAVWHVGYRAASAHAAPKADDGDGIKIELVKPMPGPQPWLNKPVVLDAEGKVPEPVPERSLLQQYWWLILLVAFVAMSGGGGAEK
ncbi:MAG: hypothetical protein M1819_005702 [Sarea resinae]|nr:MAG: hypothetical protein M1819_005702 [Sarea resinae]